ncbi:MAG: hypothetical protein JXR36_15055 [Bacteroidales bacterium]|nr:hypothetical protein [Bacteroidales bacterium]
MKIKYFSIIIILINLFTGCYIFNSKKIPQKFKPVYNLNDEILFISNTGDSDRFKCDYKAEYKYKNFDKKWYGELDLLGWKLIDTVMNIDFSYEIKGMPLDTIELYVVFWGVTNNFHKIDMVFLFDTIKVTPIFIIENDIDDKFPIKMYFSPKYGLLKYFYRGGIKYERKTL